MKKGETGVSTYIYYFTATGNSLYIAKMLGNIIPDSKIISILQSNKKEETSLEADKIGFVFPLYYGGIPRAIHKELGNKGASRNICSCYQRKQHWNGQKSD